MPRNTEVYGPAYLDRVLHVGGALTRRDGSDPLDRSMDGRLEPGVGLSVVDPSEGRIEVALPQGWPGPEGVVHVGDRLADRHGPWRHSVTGIAWHDDLGGMGAGFAAAFQGRLVSALGREDDPHTQAIATLLAETGIRHEPLFVPAIGSDWTLLITSGPFGDKLPIGFRGCHAALESLGPIVPCDLRVAASLTNRLCAEALEAPGAEVRFFAPTMRNMADPLVSVGEFAHAIDILSCNHLEWQALEDRERVDQIVPIVVVTAGSMGSRVRFLAARGRRQELSVPAFPRDRPPQDTNRAGESYASTFVTTLLDAGWRRGVAEPELIREAAIRASASAALVLDRRRFGFPGRDEIDAALEAGVVGRPAGER